MEVQTLQKKTKKLGSKKPMMKNEEKLPAIDTEILRYGPKMEQEKISYLQKTYGKYAGIRVLLPNFRYKNSKFYFYMKNPYDMSYGNFLLRKIYSINYFFVNTDLPNLPKIKVYYELLEEEHKDGLLCKIYLENSRDFGMKDYQGLCKMVEMTILNFNPTDTYELISYQDVYKFEGEYPHIHERFELEEFEEREPTFFIVEKEDEDDLWEENQDKENEEFNSQLFFKS